MLSWSSIWKGKKIVLPFQFVTVLAVRLESLSAPSYLKTFQRWLDSMSAVLSAVLKTLGSWFLLDCYSLLFTFIFTKLRRTELFESTVLSVVFHVCMSSLILSWVTSFPLSLSHIGKVDLLLWYHSTLSFLVLTFISIYLIAYTHFFSSGSASCICRLSWLWWYTPVVLSFGGVRQEDFEVENSLGYIVILCLRKTNPACGGGSACL